MAGAFPPKSKLHHHTPAWVPTGGLFHIRIRCDRSQLTRMPLTDPGLGPTLLNSVNLYHATGRWWCHLFLLMPDHLHSLIAFPPHEGMSHVIGEWKHYHASQNRVAWQEGYFDHRIRNDHELELKVGYIRENPVVKNLSASAGDWLWVWELSRSAWGGPGAPRPASEPTPLPLQPDDPSSQASRARSARPTP